MARCAPRCPDPISSFDHEEPRRNPPLTVHETRLCHIFSTQITFLKGNNLNRR
ncbi:hypothetical protein RSAG8_10431, partial [Rhizoctonia solani AG-8 WAC10335]